MSANLIVCGWYTPDYRKWVDRLVPTLDARSIPHDFVEVPKLPGTWEANTMAKPKHLLAAMERHPDKVIVLVDVDCTVHGDLTPLAGIEGDIGFSLRGKYRRSDGVRFRIQSGTVVVKPTAAARAYVEAWAAAAAEAPWGYVDQDALLVAMGRVPWCSYTVLPVEMCAMPKDKVAAPIIFHDVGAKVRKMTPRRRRLLRLLTSLLSWGRRHTTTSVPSS